MNVVATILAVEARREFAERLLNRVNAHIPTRMSINDSRNDLNDAWVRYRELLTFATLQNVDWHLFLEDDQELTNDFFTHLEALMDVGQKRDVDLFYLANRSVSIGQLSWMNSFRVNRLCEQAAGSHGLLYKTKHIPALLKPEVVVPIDLNFYHVLNCHQYRHFQILEPVMARHLGRESTLHHYETEEHIHAHE